MNKLYLIVILLFSVCLHSQTNNTPEKLKSIISSAGCNALIPELDKYRINKNINNDEATLRMLTSEYRYYFKNRSEGSFDLKVIFQVVSEDLKGEGNQSLDFNDSAENIKSITACTANYDEEEKKWYIYEVDTSRISVLRGTSSMSRLSDDFYVYMEYPNIRVNSYVILASKSDFKQVKDLPNGSSFLFKSKYDSIGYTYHNYLRSFDLPNDVKPHIYLSNNSNAITKQFKQTITKKGDRTEYKFFLDRSRYYDEERYFSLENGSLPYFVFSTYESWDYLNSFFSKRYEKIINDAQDLLSKEVGEVAGYFKIQKTEVTPAHLYKYLGDKYRYVYAHTGSGSFIPNDIKTIISQKSGDCKDQAILFVGLLRQIGFKAFPLLLNTTSSYNYALDVPRTSFNHMIVAYYDGNKKQYIVTDPTGAYTVPFGTLSKSEIGRNYVIIKPDGFIKGITPMDPIEKNLYTYNQVIKMSEKGRHQVDDESKYYGNNYDFYSTKLRVHKKEQEEYLKSQIMGTNVKIIKYSVDNLYNSIEPLTYRVEAEFDGFFEPTNTNGIVVDKEAIDSLIILPNFLSISKEYFSYSSRKILSVWADFNGMGKASRKIILPSNHYKFINIPKAFKFSSAIFDIDINYELSGDGKTLTMNKTTVDKKMDVTPKEYLILKRKVEKELFPYQDRERVIIARKK